MPAQVVVDKALDEPVAVIVTGVAAQGEGDARLRTCSLEQLRLELLILQISAFARLWVDGRWPVQRDLVLDVLLDLWRHGLRADQP